MRRRAAACLAAVSLAVGLAALASPARAQPYAAAGGFGRPTLVAGPGIVPAVGAAADGDGLVLVWADSAGVWARGVGSAGGAEGEPLAVVGPGSFRNLGATMAGGELAVAWLERDLRTGNTGHSLTWGGRDYLLFEAGQETPLYLGSGAGRPWVLATERFGGAAHLRLYTLDEALELREPLTLYSTTRAVRGASALSLGTGSEPLPTWLAWLEGETSSGPFGRDAEWSAYALPLTDADGATPAPLELGPADVLDERQRVALGAGGSAAGGGSGALALWLGVDGSLQVTTLTLAGGAAGDAAGVADTVDLGEGGRPLALLGPHAYWHVDEFIRRADLTASPREAPVSVAWSPVTIAGAQAATVGDPSEPTLTGLGWYGRTQGGAVEVYASHDLSPFTPSPADRLAALMGWSPWALWQEAAGQLLTALLVGVVGVMALAPLLFASSLLLVRLRGVSARPVVGGVLLGVLLPAAIGVYLALRFPDGGLAQLGARGLVGALSALAVGAVAAYLVNRRADREPQLAVLVTAVTVSLVAISGWAFANYDAWAPAVGLA